MIMELAEMFPDGQTATGWFESVYWPEIRCCGHCGSPSTKETPNARPMPYWCQDCRSYFNVRTGTVLQHSRVPLCKWAFAVYLYATSLKNISSMKLHRDIGVTQKTAWFMLQRLREGWGFDPELDKMLGSVEVDETYVGGRRRNMHAKERKALSGRGGISITPVVGIRDWDSNQVRAQVIQSAHKGTSTRSAKGT